MSASPDLPGWLTDIDGFSPESWWVPIVCTDRGQHDPELLGAMFEHSDTQTLGIAMTTIAGIASSGQIAVNGDLVVVGRSPGSLSFLCPECARDPRVPPSRLDQMLLATRASSPPWVDVSIYD